MNTITDITSLETARSLDVDPEEKPVDPIQPGPVLAGRQDQCVSQKQHGTGLGLILVV
jgi:hypothetical protein